MRSGARGVSDDLADILKLVDTDGSGEIDQTEFLTVMRMFQERTFHSSQEVSAVLSGGLRGALGSSWSFQGRFS